MIRYLVYIKNYCLFHLFYLVMNRDYSWAFSSVCRSINTAAIVQLVLLGKEKRNATRKAVPSKYNQSNSSNQISARSLQRIASILFLNTGLIAIKFAQCLKLESLVVDN